MILKSLLSSLINGLKSITEKKFRKEKAVCNNCGYSWNVVFPDVKGGETKLECPKCKHRNSEVITYK